MRATVILKNDPEPAFKKVPEEDNSFRFDERD